MGFVYKITNKINNKIYIGKTRHVDPYDRWREHINDYKKDKGKRPLYDAMKKYGVDNFIFEVLEETDYPEEREKFYINQFRTYVGFKDSKGYNATLGGDGKAYLDLTEEDVISFHINDSVFALGETANHFNVDRDTIKNILKKHEVPWMSGNSAARRRIFLQNKGVIQIDPYTKFVVDKYENAEEAAKELNGKRGNIQRACNTKADGMAYGFLWCYGKDLFDVINNKNIIDTSIS